jgi:glycosyltransferase involved in cell wall biosynthesis
VVDLSNHAARARRAQDLKATKPEKRTVPIPESEKLQEEQPKKTVLLVSYYFPPSGGPGVQRVLKFTRYLPRFGYRPLILTVPEDASFPLLDRTLLAEIPPQATVFRSPIREFYHLYRRAAGPAQGSINLTTTARGGQTRRERVLSDLRATFFIPDGRAGWFPGGSKVGLGVCRSEGAEVIFASGPPFTAHWIGRRIAELSGLPLVLDFRDPWIGAPFYPKRPALSRRMDLRLERSCLRRAAAVITVNREIRDDIMRRHPDLDPEAFHVISNGYDPADFEGVDRNSPPLWTLVHTGTMPNHRFPTGLVPALSSMLRQIPELAGQIRLRLIGQVDPELAAAFRTPPLQAITRLEGYRPHAESVQALRDSHTLLLLIEDGPRARGTMTGKLFEYLGSGTPILALAPEGEAAEVIRRARAGRVVPGDDPAAVEAALREAYQAYCEGRRPFGEPDPAVIEEYSRLRLTERLSELLDRVRLVSTRAGD